MAEGPLRRWLWILVIIHIAIVITDEFPRGPINHISPSEEPDLKSEKLELESKNLELESKNLELESKKLELESKKLDLESEPKNIQQSDRSSEIDQSSETRVNFCATEACVQLMLEYEKTVHENGSGIYPGRFGKKK